jgi:uncharacterized protein YlxW (UPF0749 family)
MPYVPDDDAFRDSAGRPSRLPSCAVLPALLDDVVRSALDPAYTETAFAKAARLRDGVGAPREAGTPREAGRAGSARSAAFGARTLVLVVLLVAGLLLATAARRQAVAAPGQARARTALVADVDRQAATDTALAGRVEELNQTVATLREQDLSSSTEGAELAGRIDVLEPAVGQQAVVGPGVRLTLADPSPGSRDGGDWTGRRPGQVSPVRLLDSDIAEVVNLLWAAGAEAVAVGGVRLTATTAIRSAGAALLVGFRPVTSPYVIEAVGAAGALENALATSAVAGRLRDLAAASGGEFSASSAAEVTVPAAPVTTPRRAEGVLPVVPS